MAASFLVLVLAGLLLMQQARNSIVETKRNASITEASGIHTFMANQLRLPESRSIAVYEQLNSLAEQAQEQSGQYKVIIEGPAGAILSGGITWESVPESLQSRVNGSDDMFATPTEVLFADPTLPPEPGWAVGTNLVDSSGERFPVYYIFPMTNEVATLKSLQRAVISTGLALLGALTAIAYLVTVQVVRPVRKASQTAQRLAAGNLEERMRVRGTDDIASLAVSMNDMAEDLAERIRELESLSLVQRRFVGDVSHELRTPMTTIRMGADVLYEARDEFEPQSRRTVELMSTQIDRFDSLLADLLEISRFDAGAAVLSLDEVDLVSLVESEVEAQHSFAQKQGIELRIHHDGPATAQMDSRRIRRILRNLLTNAIEHGEGRPIEVTVASDAHAVAVAVRDRGVGFQASESGLVFGRFWRADPSRNRVVGGTGLGLAIALEDARLHKGWLTAWGRPGRGAQFRLTIPRDPGHPLISSPLPVIPTDVESRRRT
ncbi:sensor histidine kinase [Tessaracoccus antarcticus]|uniref:Sensor histidine kinase MtrB n=1 Tax=Tessaracoccus antarcticus TaxID=2479848 RepID=A0A3M0GGQ2_9ACTN|nr:sensor histidine kinase [Tessaracoccus antarcticus]